MSSHSSQYTSYYLQSLNSKVGLHNARRESNWKLTFGGNQKEYCSSDPGLSKSQEARYNKSTSGPIYDILPDLMTAIREPKSVPIPKRVTSNKRGISHRRRSDDDTLRAALEKTAPSSNSKSSFMLTSNHLDMGTSRKAGDRGDGRHQLPNSTKFADSIAGVQDHMMNPGYKELIKPQLLVAQESARANRHKTVDDSFLNYRKTFESLHSKNNTSPRQLPSSSPRSRSKKVDKRVRNAIVLRRIKRGKMYGPEAIAAVSGFGITQSKIMDNSESYTYLQFPTAKNSVNKDKTSNIVAQPQTHENDVPQVSTTRPSPKDKNLWAVDIDNACTNKKSVHDNRRGTKDFSTDDDYKNEMPMPTVRKMIYQAVNEHELNRNRNNLTKLTINSNSLTPRLQNVTNSEIHMPLHDVRTTESSVHKKIPTSSSVPSMPSSQQHHSHSISPSDQRFQIQPVSCFLSTTKLHINTNTCVDDCNIGGGERMNVEAIVIGKKNKKKASKPQRAVDRKAVSRSKRKLSIGCGKRRNRSSRRDVRRKGPKIKGITFNGFNYIGISEYEQHDRELKTIRTTVLPFPMPKYMHTI